MTPNIVTTGEPPRGGNMTVWERQTIITKL